VTPRNGTDSIPRSDAPPEGPWRWIWAAAVLVLVVGLGGLELFWRKSGYRATIDSTPELWSYHRARVRGAGRDTVALVGGSRIQFGFHPEVFVEAHPGFEVVQLAVSGKRPYATLKDLAEDDSFGGLVICSVAEPTMYAGWPGQEEYVEYYRQKWGPGTRASLVMTAALQERLVLLQPRLGVQRLAEAFLQGHLPPINYIVTRFDRMQVADYGLLTEQNIRGLTTARINRTRTLLPDTPPAPEDAWRAFVADLASFKARIDARGGRVFYVRYPAHGRFRELYDEYFPRARYWDVLAAEVGDTLHFEDMPGAEELRLPDDSHMDAPSGIRFTRWIAAELAARGAFD